LPFDIPIPDWVWTTAKISVLTLIAFSAGRASLKRRKRLLEEAIAEVRRGKQ